MAIRLRQSAPDFEDRFAALLAAKREVDQDVGARVADIIADVRARGDEALIALSKTFDNVDLAAIGIRVEADEIERAADQADAETLEALSFARDRIASHHARQLPKDDRYTDSTGVELGTRWTAIQAVGIYVPGGTASYPSSVLMNAVPATVAGVGRIAMVVPAPEGEIAPLVLAAAKLAGVTEIYRLGGAQAVAALAYGTKSVAAVDKIVGPGNAYVAAAKRQVFGAVGIDMIAGPSEVLVVADSGNNPDWLAADLLAQAEHDASSQSILITDDRELADAVETAVGLQLAELPRGEIAGASWRDYGAIIEVDALDAAPPLIDRLAPEHLELAIAEPEALLEVIHNAGAIFLGAHTPEVIGDYVAGSNHVLPTARSARFSSGLGVLDFVKRSSLLRLDAEALGALAPAALKLARAEGLEAHARSIEIRLNRRDREGA